MIIKSMARKAPTFAQLIAYGSMSGLIVLFESLFDLFLLLFTKDESVRCFRYDELGLVYAILA